MRALEFILSPIVWLMELVLDFYVLIFSSVGFSILLLSFTFAVLLHPLRKIALRTEQRIGKKMKIVQSEVQALPKDLKGEKRFLATEKIYQRYDYHPIQSIGMGASFFVMLPVLVSAILLFSSGGVLQGQSFLFIDDLSQPDGLLGSINVLPLLMSAITLVDSRMRFKDDKQSQYRFFFIALVLLAIVYNLSSGLVLYWTGSNIISLITAQFQSR
jgi:membrane protein insertase Oxa1/YidC/SpoIIIJ